MIHIDNLTIKPLTPQIWQDFETLFGAKGAYGGCWCMWWRSTRKKFEKNQEDGNHLAMKSIVDSGTIPGLIGYMEDIPNTWISVAPREQYASLERSRTLKRIDDQNMWSIVCFFIHKNYRGMNLSEKLIRGAIEYVRKQKGRIIEAYLTIIHNPDAPPVSTYMGLIGMYERTGFREVYHPSKNKKIMRYFL